MKLFFYCIDDLLSSHGYQKVFLAENDEKAKSIFFSTMMVRDSEYMHNQKNYDLVSLGKYDTITGKFTNDKEIRTVFTGKEFIDSVLPELIAVEQKIVSAAKLVRTTEEGRNALASVSAIPSDTAPAASVNNEGEKTSKIGDRKASRGE